MEEPKKQKQEKKIIKTKTFTVSFALEDIQENTTINTHIPSKHSQEQIINKAINLHVQGNISEATKYYQQLIKQRCNDHRVFSNYGVILHNLDKLHEAELSYRKAIEINPGYALAHSNLGNILRDLGKIQEAEMSIRKAIELNPHCADTYGNLGVILLQKCEYNLSIKYFSESAKLLRGESNKELDQIRSIKISKAKIEHDIEQFEYLVSQDCESQKFTDLALLYKKIACEVNWPSETQLITLGDKYINLLKYSYNRLLHQIEGHQLEKGVINNSLDVKKITTNYFDHEFGLTYIDNLLSPQALKSLRKFMLGSTIWFDIKPNGYIGAYLKEGLANPLILQIADELKKKFPKIFKDYPINQIWAFKYDSRSKQSNSSLKGIKVHADFAAVNVNFWITPNEANLNSDSGGLIVYDVEAPKEWGFNTFNNDEKRIREELKKSKGGTKIIPYNENRAVIFNSNLFHETDNYEFKEGYENRRINITMLFGMRSNNQTD